MNPRVLIVGGGLSGLTTAFRLQLQGFQITLVDQQKSFLPKAPSTSLLRSTVDPQVLSHTNNECGSSNALPIVIHGHHKATLNLLKELSLHSTLNSYNSVNLEFLTDTQGPIRFKPIPAPYPLHILLGILFFKGIPLKDRWSLIKSLEQLWEGDLELPANLDSQHAHAWLSTFGHSKQAVRNLWQPLCHFFLGTSSHQSSAQYFQKTLAQYFLSERKNARTFIPPIDETTLLLKPLYDHLITHKDIIWHSDSTAINFQYNSKGITSVQLSDGTALSADFYVSALPRKTFISCLHEQLLAKFSYFSNLSQLSEVPALIVNLEIPDTTTRPRLLLSTNTFHWMALWPQMSKSTCGTMISAVATDDLELLEKSDNKIFSQFISTMPSFLKGKINTSHLTSILRRPHALLSCKPHISSFRPIQKSPVPNLFVAGPWTDTDLPASRESSIVSANLCAQAVMNSVN